MKTGYAKTVLPNGVRVISEQVPSVPSVSVGVWLHVGSRDEPARLNGVSHYIEHMLFKRTKKRSALAIAETLESLGGSMNAFTARESTCYYGRLNGAHLDKAMEVLGDILNNSVFDPVDMRKERQVILEEINDLSDTPSELVHDLFVEQLFDSHPLGLPILGKVPSIKSLKRQIVLEYLGQHYCSPNLVIAGTGAVSHQRLVDLTKRYFKWSKGGSGNNGTVPAPIRTSIIAYKKRTKQTHVCLGFPNYSFPDQRRYIMSAISAYLSAGMSARLFQKVREEKGYCYNIYSYQEFFRDNGLFCIYFSADRAQVVKATTIILKELRLLKEQLLNRATVNKTKEQLKGSLMLAQESMYNRMNRIAQQELTLNSFTPLEEHCRRIDHITPRQMRDAVNEIFDLDRMAFCSLGPTTMKDLETVRWSAL